MVQPAGFPLSVFNMTSRKSSEYRFICQFSILQSLFIPCQILVHSTPWIFIWVWIIGVIEFSISLVVVSSLLHCMSCSCLVCFSICWSTLTAWGQSYNFMHYARLGEVSNGIHVCTSLDLHGKHGKKMHKVQDFHYPMLIIWWGLWIGSCCLLPSGWAILNK